MRGLELVRAVNEWRLALARVNAEGLGREARDEVTNGLNDAEYQLEKFDRDCGFGRKGAV